MKPTKTLFLLLALLFVNLAMYGQNADSKSVNEIFREFSKEKGVTRVNNW